MRLVKMIRSIVRSALALGSACALPAAAHAAVVYNEIIVQDALGHILASVTATPAEIAHPVPDAVFYVPGIAIDMSQDGNYGNVVDGLGNPLEVFGVAYGGPDVYDLGFGLQSEASIDPVQNPVLDTGIPIDMTMYLDPALQAAGDTATFIVSANSPAVPEPLTWAMMVVGLAAIGGSMRCTAYNQRTTLTYS